jgi:hypothetical protein
MRAIRPYHTAFKWGHPFWYPNTVWFHIQAFTAFQPLMDRGSGYVHRQSPRQGSLATCGYIWLHHLDVVYLPQLRLST